MKDVLEFVAVSTETYLYVQDYQVVWRKKNAISKLPTVR